MSLREAGASGLIQCVESGEHAIAYLAGEGRYAERDRFPYPGFLITDLKMPHGDGFSILEHLQNTPEFPVIPTLVLSASSDADDVKKSYMLGASAYLVKPQDFQQLKTMMKLLYEFWSECEVPVVDRKGRTVSTESFGKLGARFSSRTRYD
jgi:CheY-like chemotaxis protein